MENIDALKMLQIYRSRKELSNLGKNPEEQDVE